MDFPVDLENLLYLSYRKICCEGSLLVNVLRGKVQPLLDQLCQGIAADELPAALQGLMASKPGTRAAALAALLHVPSLAFGKFPTYS